MADPDSSGRTEIRLWTQDAIVLFDWLNRVDLNAVGASEHPSVKQALADLSSALEQTMDPYGESGTGLTEAEIDAAQEQVARDMGW